jgi:multimeric flavodoxin WrbA
MKVTIINGSPRKNGANSMILNYFKELLIKTCSDIEIEYINLIDCNIKYCIGCRSCHRTGKCIFFEDRVEEIHDIIKNSNGVIFGSPTYPSNVSGLYKNFHDRIHMTMEQLLYRKPCINVTTYEYAKGIKALMIMRAMVINSGGYNVSLMAVKNSSNRNPLNEKNKSRIARAVKKFYKRIQKNKPPIFSGIYTTIAINSVLKPFVYKDKEQNQGIINSWIEQKIIKRH